MKKQASLVKRVQQAERKERDAKRRMFVMDRKMRESNALAEGAMIWVIALASLLGEDITITAEQIDKAKTMEYFARRNDDGSYDLHLYRQENMENEQVE